MTHTQIQPAAALGSHQQVNAAGIAPVDADPSHGSTGAPSFVSQAAMEAILAMRVRQMEQYGHTPEADMTRPIGDLIHGTGRYMRRLREDVSCNAPLDSMERNAIALGAMALALIDRIQGEKGRRLDGAQ